MNTLFRWQVLPVRVVSALVPIGLIVAGVWFSEPNVHWTFLLATAVALGYVHFIIATTYQIKGILRSPERRRLLRWFFALVFVSATISIGLMLAGHTLLLAVLSIGYFVLHVLANEHTFLQRETKVAAPYWSFLSLVVPLGAVYGVSLLHPSLYFDYDLQYPSGFDLVTRIDVLSSYFPVDVLTPLAFIATAAFTMLVPLVLYRKYQAHTTALSFFLVGVLTLAFLSLVETVVFMYVLHFVLLYHFVLLSLLFIKPMVGRGKRVLTEYALLHVILLVPLAVALALFMNRLGRVDSTDYIFQFQIFIAVSLVHITASLINEPWFRRWLHL